MPAATTENHELFKTMLSRFEAEFDGIASLLSRRASDRKNLELVREKYGELKDRIAERLKEAQRVSSTQTEHREFFGAFVIPCLRDIKCSLRARRSASGDDISASVFEAHGELRWWAGQLD